MWEARRRVLKMKSLKLGIIQDKEVISCESCLKLISDTMNLGTFLPRNTSPKVAILMPERFSSSVFTTSLSASHTKPCHIADFYEKRKRQSQIASTKPHTIASIHRLIRTMYDLITHNKLYDYTLSQNH